MGSQNAARAVVFSPLDDGTGRAQLVTQRLTDGIISGMLKDGERLPSESDLAKRLGVAVTTAREALDIMRDQGLLRTRRGREGGSFVTYDRETAAKLLDDRLRSSSRIELRDLCLVTSALAGTAAEEAADRASDEDIETLTVLAANADISTAGGARRAAARFGLEIAAISQSPRLVREEIRLQAESGPILWLCLTEEKYRILNRDARGRVLEAIRRVDPAQARESTVQPIRAAFEWLIEQRVRES
ncbi:hypothetical protein LK09_19685 [Microbacterium mangrovi]|uniref:HTH gntR-type domain-containing protein n=2 Tax=Microbacterium mangrovi TaxID=1348253 RepID=A0A0B2A107_9MICO|nr:hypothetical protein LK09_19685 [Microbacterium mangrovi]